MNTLAAPAETKRQQKTGFWSHLLNDQSMHSLTDLERLVTGCEIIAELDELQLLEQVAR